MAILTTRAVAATVTELVTRVRIAVSDSDPSSANQRWSDADIRRAIDAVLSQMYCRWSSQDPGAFQTYIEMTYTADARLVPLPTTGSPTTAPSFAGSQIYRIEDVTLPTQPVSISYRGSLEALKYTDEHAWALVGDSIALSPIPSSARTLRIYILATYIPVGSATSDQHAFPVNHEELIVQAAAMSLQENDNAIPPSRPATVAMLWQLFMSTMARHAGRTYVQNTRMIRG